MYLFACSERVASANDGAFVIVLSQPVNYSIGTQDRCVCCDSGVCSQFGGQALIYEIFEEDPLRCGVFGVQDGCVPLEPRGKSFQPSVCLCGGHVSGQRSVWF